jgi:undecaprenyl-phosphate 4-deoxy-4-formamido-L-arabinose transferase
MTRLSVIIPCYQSEHTIANVVDEITQTIATNENYSYEIILINDCSPDNSYEEIKRLVELNKHIKAINFSANFGQHAALMAGFRFASGDIIICLDDDGQTPANELFKLVEKVEKDSDLVFASYKVKKHSFLRNCGSYANDLMAQYLIGKPKSLYISSYFACRKFIAKEVSKYKNPYPYISGMLLQTTQNISNVEVTHRFREAGTSGYSFSKLVLLWLNGFTAFSIKPLRIATISGSLFALFGFLYGGFIIVQKLVNPAILLGYSSLMSAIIFMGGITMLMLGMIGEYLGRIYLSINNLPQYVVKDTLNIEKQ